MNCKRSKLDGYMTSRKVPEVPFEAVSVDHFGPLQAMNGFKYVIVLVEHTTRYLICRAQKSTKSGEFIRFMDEEIICKFGAPLVVISDRGTCFTSLETFEYFEYNGVSHYTSPAYYPESNGLAERAVKTVKDTLRRQMNGIQDWKKELNRAVFNINISVNSSIGCSPFELLYGFQPRLFDEMVIGSVLETDNRLKQVIQLKEKRKEALQTLQNSLEIQS
ncbi:uncharacterized protein B4U80_12239, partial [Leptotrombidium deliense]